MIIANEDLLPLAAAVDTLTDAFDNNELLSSKTADELHDVLSRVQTRLKIPVTKGSGHSNIEHVAACFAHTLLLETSGLAGFTRSRMEHVSATTDLGTESGIASFNMESPTCSALSPLQQHQSALKSVP